MSEYAVIKIKGIQYKVAKGQELIVNKIIDEQIDPEILLYVNEDKVVIGKPYVKGHKVYIKITDKLVKGKKIHIYKYKAKSRYRKRIGFRPLQTKLLIEKIS